jgi:lysophospholipase L1-like esterase
MPSPVFGPPTCHAGYRKYLWRYLTDAGYAPTEVSFVGPFNNGPTDVDTSHAGYPGAAIGPSSSNWDLLYYLPQWAASKPDIILLMIGTNDIWSQQFTGAQLVTRLSNLINKTFQALPKVKLLLASLLSMPEVNKQYPKDFEVWRQYNAAMPDLAANFTRRGMDVTFVDSYGQTGMCPPEPNDLCCLAYDVHPAEFGYARLALVWYQALVQVLPKTATS